jgi:hypothetical protein
MKKILLGTVLLALAIVIPLPTRAEVNISIGIPLPPPIVFGAPPAVIVIPDTDSVYVVPDVEVDIFFWNGWWWRPWEGRWYRSHYYNRGWAYYNNVPRFYFDVDPGWRGYYRDHDWYGHRWNYERIPDRKLQQNWRSWREERHWERQGTWGVQGYQPRPHQQIQELRHQRQEQYQQRPEVQRHRQWIQEQQRKPPVQRSEKRKMVTPPGGSTERGVRQQVRPSERRRSLEGSAPGGERRQVKPGKRVKPVERKRGPESGDERGPGERR